jgi:sodium/proline symporter
MLWTFFGYLGVLILLGLVAKRYTSDLDDYVLADRKMGVWATSLSYEVTAYSGWLMLAFPGRAVTRGFAAIWVGVACVVGDALNWILISRRLREETQQLKALTVPEYLDRKFHRDGSHSIRIAASLAVMTFMLIYLWSQMVAAGKTIAVSIPYLDYFGATVLTTVVIMIYTSQGGYRGVVWVDMFQGVMMLLALVVLPIICFAQLGGWPGLEAALDRASAEAAASGDAMATQSGHLGELFAGLAGLALFTFLFEDAGVGAGYIGQPHICTRFMSAEKPRHLRVAMSISVLFAMLVCTGAVAVGLVAHGWFQFAGPQTMAPIDPAQVVDPSRFDLEVVLPRLVMEIFPGWLAGLVLSTIMCDVISSAAGYLMAGASSAVEDIYYRIFRRKAGQRELLRAGRLITIGLAAIAGLLAMTTKPSEADKPVVYYLVLYAWGGLASAFSAPVLLAIYFRGMTRAGCLAGIIAGSVTCLIWHNTPALAALAYEVIPAVLVSAASIFVVSWLTQPATQPTEATQP